MAKPVPLWRPKTFTSAEAMLEEVRGLIRADSSTIKVIAAQTGVAPGTIYNIVSGKTKWPRPTTTFPLLDALGYQLSIQRKER
jgi:DNA-binding phage protein